MITNFYLYDKSILEGKEKEKFPYLKNTSMTPYEFRMKDIFNKMKEIPVYCLLHDETRELKGEYHSNVTFNLHKDRGYSTYQFTLTISYYNGNAFYFDCYVGKNGYVIHIVKKDLCKFSEETISDIYKFIKKTENYTDIDDLTYTKVYNMLNSLSEWQPIEKRFES